MSNNISTLRNIESRVLRENKGVISAAGAQELIAQVKQNGSNAEDIAALKEIFAHDAFAKGVDPSKLLTSAKLKGAEKVKVDQIAGTNVGTAQVAGRPVQVAVKRTFGPVEGFANRYQAISTARLSGADPVAVVKDAKGNFHAVELSMELGKPAAGVTPIKKFDQAELRRVSEDPSLSKADRYRKLASIELGIPEREINVVNDKSQFKKGTQNESVINIDISKAGVTGGGQTVHQHGAGCGCDDVTLELSTSLIDGPVARMNEEVPRAQTGNMQPATDAMLAVNDKSSPNAKVLGAVDSLATTLFHEGTHVADGQLVDRAVTAYGKPLPDPNERSEAASTARGKFSAWLKKAPGFSAAERAQIEKFTFREGGGNPSIEAKAYVGAFVASFERNPGVAQGQLRRVGQGEIQPKVREQLVKDLRHRFETLPADRQDEFRKIVEAADKESGQKFGPALWP